MFSILICHFSSPQDYVIAEVTPTPHTRPVRLIIGKNKVAIRFIWVC